MPLGSDCSGCRTRRSIRTSFLHQLKYHPNNIRSKGIDLHDFLSLLLVGGRGVGETIEVFLYKKTGLPYLTTYDSLLPQPCRRKFSVIVGLA